MLDIIILLGLIIGLVWIIKKIVNMFLNKPEEETEQKRNTTKNNNNYNNNGFGAQNNYYTRKYLMTKYERKYLDIIQEMYPNYKVVPQVCLFSVIKKKYNKSFKELFKTVDIGIFDENYSPIMLIEINDESHQMEDRQRRDNSVYGVCYDAGIPIYMFDYDNESGELVDENELFKALKQHLD